MPFVQAPDGCELHYDFGGQGEPLLLIPGLGGSASFWAGVAERLAPTHRIIAVDHRGAGRNGRPEGEYSIAQLAADALCVLDAEGVAAAHVVGHSTGGAVAQSLAIDAPFRVRSLVLSATWPRPDARFRQLFEARLEVLLRAGPACYQRLTHVLGYAPAYLDAHEAELEAAVAQAETALAPLTVTAARIRMLLAFDRADELHRVSAPCLVVGATDDAIVPFDQSERLTGLIPGARLSAVEGGHFHPRAHPERLAELVRQFCGAASSG